MKKRIFTVLMIVFVSSASFAQNPLAFPGAEGFGKFTTGGRGGKIIFVTNLNDDGPGSLREAIQVKEPRTILFTVSGTIALNSPLQIASGNVTIAGQSAPGDGICIKNYTVEVNANNVIVRFLRFRMGDEKHYEGDAFGGTKGFSNIIIDHCSMSWSTDESASFYRNKNFTMQWCIIAESLNHSVHAKGDHGYGGIWGGEKASFHHNLLASHTSRLPRFSGSSTTPNGPNELVDFRNNIIYNWMSNNMYGGERGRYNMVNNYYKPGPSTKKSSKDHILNPYSPLGKFYMSGNYLQGNEQVSANNRQGIKADNPDSTYTENPFEVEAISEQTAAVSCELVLKIAGASYKRDNVDSRIAEEVKSGKSISGKNKNGIIDSQNEVGGWPDLKSLPPPQDTDHDGMPDTWEKNNKLNAKDPVDATQHTIDKNYDNLEVYLNSLVENVVYNKGK
jgi:pectate lyase